LPGISCWFCATTTGFAASTKGGSWLTGPSVGSGKLSNGFTKSGIVSSVKGTSNNLDLISPKIGAASIKGLGKPNLSAFSWKAFITLSEIFNRRNTPSLTVP